MPAKGLAGNIRCALPALLAILALAGTGAGCGSAAKVAARQSALAHPRMPASGPATRSYAKIDGDADADDQRPPGRHADDASPVLARYGPRARPEDARAIAALVKSYYRASLAGAATRACSLLSSSLAEGLSAAQRGSAEGRAGCAEPMGVLLTEQHRRLVSEEVSTMRVSSVHVKGDLGLAVLNFHRTPESVIVVEREGGTWRIDALVGTYMS
jgi:hypothetical protein